MCVSDQVRIQHGFICGLGEPRGGQGESREREKERERKERVIKSDLEHRRGKTREDCMPRHHKLIIPGSVLVYWYLHGEDIVRPKNGWNRFMSPVYSECSVYRVSFYGSAKQWIVVLRSLTPHLPYVIIVVLYPLHAGIHIRTATVCLYYVRLNSH